jgi:hypothetical protein
LATIVLAQAFVEKLLHAQYYKLGFSKVANKGLNAILQHAKQNNTISSFLIKQIDEVRLFRNPITHTKAQDYPYGLDKRSYDNKTSPFIQLEKDAKKVVEIATLLAIKNFTEII